MDNILHDCYSCAKMVPPRVEILEEPCSSVRFRYQTESRSPPVQGVHSTKDNRTFPAIKLVGCTGPGIVIVSTVTKNEPFRVHPNNIVGRGETIKHGICRIKLAPGQSQVVFSHLGIEKVKRTNVEKALAVKEEKQLDPFRQGFAHKNQPQQLDLNCIRLCFQVFLGTGLISSMRALPPIVSEPISEIRHAHRELDIVRFVPRAESPADGSGEAIVAMCEKVAHKDIRIRFFEERDGNVVWEDFGFFTPKDVHKHCTITFEPPAYRDPNLTGPVVVNVQLLRPSDGATSEPVPFTYVPPDYPSTVELPVKKKQKKSRQEPSNHINAERQNKNVSLAPPTALVSQPPGLNDFNNCSNAMASPSAIIPWDYSEHAYDTTIPLQPTQYNIPVTPTEPVETQTEPNQIQENLQLADEFVQNQMFAQDFGVAAFSPEPVPATPFVPDYLMMDVFQTLNYTEYGDVLTLNPSPNDTYSTPPNIEQDEPKTTNTEDALSASLSDLSLKPRVEL